MLISCASMMMAAGCAHRRPSPPPPDDMISISGQSFVGDDLGCAAGTLVERHYDQVARVQLTVRTFQIDRRVVSCEEYERCVEAGACTHKWDVMRCMDGIAAAQRRAAMAYCTWRNARIPSWDEWQLAIRGPDACDYPTCHEHRPEYDLYDSNTRGIITKSPMRVDYQWNGHAWLANEITRDDDCWDPNPGMGDGSLIVGPVSGYVSGAIHASVSKPSTDRGMFRCVRD